MDFTEERTELAAFMRRIYERQLTTSTGGNASLRLGDGRILITPSGLDKGATRPEELVVIGMDGARPEEGLKPSMESSLHAAIYAKRPDSRSVMHAHPLFAASYCSTGREIRFDISAESRAVLGEPAVVPYIVMGSRDLAEAVSEAARGADVVLMGNHGVVTVGSSLREAFNRIELVEAAAKTSFITEVLGGVRALTPGELDLIDMLVERNRGPDKRCQG